MVRTINFNIYKTPEGYFAEHTRYREIMVFGDNMSEVKNHIKELLSGYVEAFPETKRRFFTNDKMLDFKFTKKDYEARRRRLASFHRSGYSPPPSPQPA